MPSCVLPWGDSYPFVCVLMLSDVSNMIGGETALQASKASLSTCPGGTDLTLSLTPSLSHT